jgi:predicted thioesterase
MESAAVRSLAGHLPPSQTSVGSRIDVRHLAPTPVGMRVRARAELTNVQGRRLEFRLEAWDEVEQIGTATHERFIVTVKRFVAQAQAKGND